MWSGRFLSDKKTESPALNPKVLLLIVVMVGALAACGGRKTNPNENLRLEDYSSLYNESYSLSARQIRREIRRMVAADSDSMLADFYARTYYVRENPFVWIGRSGVAASADTLASRLGVVEDMGFSTEKFRLKEIEGDLGHARKLDFDGKGNGINKVYARLEYNLTKALFRFSAGQAFGYANPNRTLNRLDRSEPGGGSFRTLYDLGSPSLRRSFLGRAVHAVGCDSLAQFLDSVEPRNPYYRRLARILTGDSVRLYGRRAVMVNMERSRWRVNDYPWLHRKYVLVNIPSLHLVAVDGDRTETMRIGCGSLKTKTPLLASRIKRMDINPQWIMPRSIVRKSIIPRLGNNAYFRSRHYFIRDRATGRNIEPGLASPEALLSGAQLAIQEGGEGNALGRIIFRFDNNFSIYLHDTSSRDVFDRADRDVSHGCIRVEKPYGLAAFLLGDKHKDELGRIWYSIHADVSPLGKKRDSMTDEQKAVADTLQRKKLIGRVEVSPAVPLFIWYYTLYPDIEGNIRAYADVYGYDDLIYRCLENYM